MSDYGYIWTPKDALSDQKYMQILQIPNKLEAYAVLGMIRHLLDVQWIEGCLPLAMEDLAITLFLDPNEDITESQETINGDLCFSKNHKTRKKRKKKSTYAISKNKGLETSNSFSVFLKYKTIFMDFFPPCPECKKYRLNPKLDAVKIDLITKIEKRRKAAISRWGSKLAYGKNYGPKRCKCQMG